MGEYMNSKGLVGLFKIKVALVTALLCSVSFPHQAIAAGVSATTGDEILAGLKAGDVWFLLEGNRDISIPNPGEVFDQILYNVYGASWVESSYALTFMGDVTFKDATFAQIYNAADKGPVTVFDGTVFKNKGTLAFSGESITFVDNAVQGIINFVENKKAASPLDGFGGAIYAQTTGTMKKSSLDGLVDGAAVVTKWCRATSYRVNETSSNRRSDKSNWICRNMCISNGSNFL